MYYIADVIVHPDHQGAGIGRALMDRVLQYIENGLRPGQFAMVILLAAGGKEPFYEKHGFIARPDAAYGAGMSLRIAK